MQRYRRSAALVSVLLVLADGLLANSMADSQQSRTIDIRVNEPRPLAAVLRVLEQQFGAVITYEDPLYLHGNDISDVTESVRKVPDPTKPRILIPRSGSFAFNYALAEGPQYPQIPAVLHALVKAHDLTGNAGQFRVEQNGSTFHIVPSMMRSRAGTLEALTPVFDTPISLTEQDWTGYGLLQALVRAVSQATGIAVKFGTVPINLLANTKLRLGATNEVARSVLVRSLGAMTSRKFSWHLYYDPAEPPTYFLNIHPVKEAQAPAQ